MPNAKTFTGSADLDAMVARIAPAILVLLADGVPRTKATIAKAFAGRHAEDEVGLTLIRLAVTGQVRETGGRYTPAVTGRSRPHARRPATPPPRPLPETGRLPDSGAARRATMAHERVEIRPDVMFGKPVIRGTRVPVELILRKLAAGQGPDEILRQHPRLTPEDIRAAQAYAADLVAGEEVAFG
jgi:uncharacterized protein (DUF433 family)